MFKIEELSGSLIRSGRFKDAIPKFFEELRLALTRGVITEGEMFALSSDFAEILLNPSNIDNVSFVSERMLKLALRIPDYVPNVTTDYEKNVKASRGLI